MIREITSSASIIRGVILIGITDVEQQMRCFLRQHDMLGVWTGSRSRCGYSKEQPFFYPPDFSGSYVTLRLQMFRVRNSNPYRYSKEEIPFDIVSQKRDTFLLRSVILNTNWANFKSEDSLKKSNTAKMLNKKYNL